MKKILQNHKKYLFPGAFLLMLIGMSLIGFGLAQTSTVIIDGEPQSVRTGALTVSGVLRAAGVPTDPTHRVVPSRSRLIWGPSAIKVNTARNVLVMTPDDDLSLYTADRIPANILQELEIDLFPQDQLMINGATIDPDTPVQTAGSLLIQYSPAVPVILEIDKFESTFYTSQPTLGQALEEAGMTLIPQDWVSEDLSTPVNGPMQVSIRRARPVTVSMSGGEITGLTSAVTVGDALADLEVPVQYLNYSIPEDNAQVPQDRKIKLVQVNETLQIMTDEVPYENAYVEDPDTLLDQTSVVEPGQVGIFATRERIKFENGEEIWRSPQESWQASESKDGVLGYGTKVEIRREVVDGQEIEYWRKITVYATSYKPCDNQGVCHPGTATGIMPVQKGSVAVRPGWLSVPEGYGMWGQSVYIPGYGRGVIADVGGGIPGRPWIDLGYSEEDYVSWHHWTTMYFLTPVPNWYPAIILP